MTLVHNQPGSAASGFLCLAALLLMPSPLRASTANAGEGWDARAAEHLLNRAGFGGTSADVARLVALGREKAIESFFPDPNAAPKPKILSQGSLHGGLESPDERHATIEERREGFVRMQPDLILPLNRFGDWWFERMQKSEDPLRDRMTIFWHGHFVSSVKDVMSAHDMIRQIRFLRDHALGPFETLVHGIGRDPAMLRYLNNDTNVKDHPNENWARELMELFSLGDGNYTETDIKQAARAFTGWSREGHEFEFKRSEHDFGEKRVLSVDGNLDGDAVIDVILEQPACGRFLARKIIAHMEGVTPGEARVEEYAEFLRRNEYDIGKMLRKLFADPQFYRDEVVGTRVAGPVEYLVGCARRLQLEVPGQMLLNAGDVLGQRLFWPPSVKGWEGGMAWITTATMMQRSNMVGVMLGLVDVRSLMHDEEFEPDGMGAPGSPGAPGATGAPAAMKPVEAAAAPGAPGASAGGDTAAKSTADKERPSRTNGFNHLRYIQRMGWKPELVLAERARSAHASTDASIVDWMLDELLATAPTPGMGREPLAFLQAQRERAGIPADHLLDDTTKAEPVLRELAHLILSLPEAQMN